MTYATTNPPSMLVDRVGNSGAVWWYRSADAIADVDATDYITNADDLGMKTGDVVFVMDTGNGLTTITQATVDADGNATLTALTAVP